MPTDLIMCWRVLSISHHSFLTLCDALNCHFELPASTSMIRMLINRLRPITELFLMIGHCNIGLYFALMRNKPEHFTQQRIAYKSVMCYAMLPVRYLSVLLMHCMQCVETANYIIILFQRLKALSFLYPRTKHRSEIPTGSFSIGH